MTSPDHKTWYGRALKTAAEGDTTNISGGMVAGRMTGAEGTKVLNDIKTNLTNKVLPDIANKVKGEMDKAFQNVLKIVNDAQVPPGVSEQIAMAMISSWMQGGGTATLNISNMTGMIDQMAQAMAQGSVGG